MDIETLVKIHESRKPKAPEGNLRCREYRKHYPLVKQAVGRGIPLLTTIRILQEKEGAFHGKRAISVWQAYRRALAFDNIPLRETKE